MKTTTHDDDEIDGIDMVDWMQESYPECYQAIRYCSWPSIVQTAERIWRKVGCPKYRGEE